MTATPADHIDFAGIQEALAQLLDLGGPAFVTEMIDLLNQQTPQQFDAIEKALASGDIVTAQRHAHSMKSSFGNFGATRCQELATRMDRAGKSGDSSAYRIEFELLKPAFVQLQAALTATNYSLLALGERGRG